MNAQPKLESSASNEVVSEATLELMRAGRDIHMAHYGASRLPFACIRAHGLQQQFVQLEGPKAGRIYETIDASGGYASACLGAGHEVIRQATNAAVVDSGYVTDEVVSYDRALLLNTLFGPSGLWTSHFPAGQYHVSGRNSGSEGIELALRLVHESRFDLRNLTVRKGREKRQTILAFEGAWHGWTSGVISLLNRRHYRVGLPEFNAQDSYGFNTAFVPFGDVAILEDFFREHGSTLAAVFVEPIQGDAGIIVPTPGYLRRLSEFCQEFEVLLVADEVLTFAKSGNFFAMCDDDGPIPTDITVVGKSLGMGVQSCSLVIARRELTVRPSGAVATSDLRPLTCAVIRAGINHIVEAKLLERSALLGEELRQMLHGEVVKQFPELYLEIRGRGYLNGIELTEKAAQHLWKLRNALIEHGVYIEFMAGAGRRSKGLRYLFPAMRVAPPLIASHDDLVTIVANIRRGTETFIEGCS